MVALVDSSNTNRFQHSGSFGRSPSNFSAIGAGVSGAPSAPFNMKRRATKGEVADAFIANLRERGGIDVDAPGFAESIKLHFETLPSRYASRSSRTSRSTRFHGSFVIF